MPEIGSTLREARTRARIDISEIEAETKIRAKYLRALENEEWGLLPGPAYVRSFLRTYAEALGLDAKLLLEEYKLRHERPSDHDLLPIGGSRRRGRGRGTVGPPPPVRQRQRQPRGLPPWAPIAVVVLLLLGALYLLGTTGGDDNEASSSTTTRGSRTTTTPVPQSDAQKRAAREAVAKRRAAKKRRERAAAEARIVKLQIIPTNGPVFACLQDAGGNLKIRGATLQAGFSTGTYRSKSFKLRLGNGNVRLRVNGKLRDVADASPIGYVITRKSVRRVDLDQVPDCVR
jgi:cytoskeleton protein RodZ